MADYRLHASIISRSGAKSVVAAAAYRAGERILDERTGDVKDYTRKRGIMDTLILTPTMRPSGFKLAPGSGTMSNAGKTKARAGARHSSPASFSFRCPTN